MMSNVKVLIVDDEVEFASALAERLELRGFDVLVANSGSESLLLYEQSVPSVVVLDLKMPDMSGLDVLVAMKKINSTVAVIMLTGHGSASSGILGMEQGAYDYMMKPVDIGELVEKIKMAHKATKSAK